MLNWSKIYLFPAKIIISTAYYCFDLAALGAAAVAQLLLSTAGMEGNNGNNFRKQFSSTSTKALQQAGPRANLPVKIVG